MHISSATLPAHNQQQKYKHYHQKYVVIDKAFTFLIHYTEVPALHKSTEEQLVLCLPYLSYHLTIQCHSHKNQEAGKEAKATSVRTGIFKSNTP